MANTGKDLATTSKEVGLQGVNLLEEYLEQVSENKLPGPLKWAFPRYGKFYRDRMGEQS